MLPCGLSALSFIHAVGGGLGRLHDGTKNTCALMPICMVCRIEGGKILWRRATSIVAG